ncbi:MAG: hypothetical protein K1X78_20145 [Verrucomicrobiaceae bacterium]|nr:hypothetical protein [Verrucomicrobiaceae bacterium]
MNSLVSLVFDCIGWCSAALQAVFFGLARGNADAEAALVSATCLLAIMACHDVLQGRITAGRAVRMIVVPVLVLLTVQLLAVHLGSRVTTLSRERIRPVEAGCFSATVPGDVAASLAKNEWTLVCARGRLSPQQWFLADPRMRQVEYQSRVIRKQGGRYHLNGRTITFSVPDGADPTTGGCTVRVVRPRTWMLVLRGIMCAGFLCRASWLAARRAGPSLRQACAALRREKLLLGALAGFGLFFGAHQWRFIAQDSRMQMVTSRDDDGYMFARLEKAAELKTMDPLALGNKAYGAIAFYPFALPSFLAGHAGATPSVHFLNAWSRGLKLLVSLGALAAVWQLGAGRFGRPAALAAVLLLATNQGFLAYSSYPFYPDVLMAFFATLALHHMLKLRTGWDARAFSCAILFAAASVSVKFITFLLFPFILAIGAAALWKHEDLSPRERATAFVTCALTAGMMSVAVFFLCNPFLAYNIEWTVPNYKLCGNYYSAETPQIVAGAAATIRTWIEICYRNGRDAADLVMAALALAATPVIWLASRMRRNQAQTAAESRRMEADAESAALLVVFAVLFQLYLLRTVTLGSAIDWRLLLPVYPVFYLAAAWSIGLLFRPRPVANGQRLGRMAFACVVGAAALALITPRLGLAAEFFRSFGRPPEKPEVAAWLDRAGVPQDALVMTSLQSWIPPKFGRVLDGVWHPRDLREMIYKRSALPAVFIEDESYFDQYFSGTAGGRGFNTTHQQDLHDDGAAFYGRLRAGRLTPWVLAATGSEVVATNALSPASTKFRAYVNPFILSENLAARASIVVAHAGDRQAVDALTPRLSGELSWEWHDAVTAGFIHLTATEPENEALSLRLEDAQGHVEMLPVTGPGDSIEQSAQRFLRVDPPRDIRRITIVPAGGDAASGPRLVRDLHVYPPAPIGLNVTSHCFDIRDTAGTDKVRDLIAWQPASHAGVPVTPRSPLQLVLTPRARCDVERTSIIFDAAALEACAAHCTYVFEDGSRADVAAAGSRVLQPACVCLAFDCPPGKTVTRIECRVTSTADVKLRQIHVRANPKPEAPVP